MTETEWHERIGQLVRVSMQSEAYKRYYGIKLTKPRAEVYITQHGLYIRRRRDCWAYVSGNCTELSVRQKILLHEYEEMICDEYSDSGHLDLVTRQAKSIGLPPEAVINAIPLPTTRAVLYAYGWITRERPWQEGLGALIATERGHDSELLQDLGGGHSLKTARKWMEDLGLTWEDVPNSAVHSKADEKHSKMFLSCLAEFVPPDQEPKVLQAVRESLELRELMYWGISDAMEKIR